MGSPRWAFKRLLPLLLLVLFLPAVLGGCPEFGNDLVNAVDAFTRSVNNAIIDLFFDLFRSDGVT